MIVLHTFGPLHDMIDVSPFVTKAHALLRLAGLEYEAARADVRKAPKGKLPVIVDDGQTIPDSTFIRLHIERKYGFDFDAGLDATARAQSWAVEKLFEDNLFWIALRERWVVDEYFARGPALFFESIPWPLRQPIIFAVRRNIRNAIHAQGTGRHTDAERAEIARRGIGAIAQTLGDKPYLMGEKPCAADASIFAFFNAIYCPVFDTPMQAIALEHENLVAYSARLAAQWFPDVKQTRGSVQPASALS